MRSLSFLAIFAAAVSVAQVAEANCSATESVTSRALFTNAGAYATVGAAGISVVNCSHSSGLYGEVFVLTPFREFDIGKEIDGRIGWQFSLGDFKADASFAVYRYGLGTDYSTDLDGRLRFIYEAKVDPRLTISPYVGVDLSRSLSFGADNHSVFGGVDGRYKLTEYLDLNAGGAVWHHFDESFLNYDPTVWSVSIGPSLKLSDNLSLSGNYAAAWGGLKSQGQVKEAITFTLNLKF